MGFAAAPGSGGSSSCGASSPKIVLSRRIFFYPVLVVAYLCGKSQCQQIEVGETDCSWNWVLEAGAGRSTALHPCPGIQVVNGAALGISALCLVFWHFALAQNSGGCFCLQLALHGPCSRFLPLLRAVTPVSMAVPRIQSSTGIQTSR